MRMWPDAVLWDMDGTLIDSERAWLDAAAALACASDTTLEPAQLDRLVGASMTTTAKVLQESGVRGSAEVIVGTLTEQVRLGLVRDLRFRAGALELAASVAAAGVPQAIVSMSNRSIVDFVASASPVQFTARVAGDDVVHGKPHPEAYLLAAERLGAEPGRCIALEDSTTGLTAAIASGAVAVAVPLYLPVDAAGAVEWDDLVGRDFADLQALQPLSPAPITALEER